MTGSARTNAEIADLLGFAVERTEFKDRTRKKVAERYFLRGIKRFEDKDKGLPPGTPVPTSEHPIQSFQWGDYTAKPSTAERRKAGTSASADTDFPAGARPAAC